jgi:hypothetical protein
MFHACYHEDLELVKMLVEKGADVVAESKGLKPPLVGAFEQVSHVTIVVNCGLYQPYRGL